MAVSNTRQISKSQAFIVAFMVMIAGLLLSNRVLAQSASATFDTAQIQVQQLKDSLSDDREVLCDADMDEEDEYDEEILKTAYKISDAYAKAASATQDNPWATLGGSELGEAYQCANKYLNHVASVKRRQAAPGTSVADRIIAASGDCWPCNIAFLMIDSIQQLASIVYDTVTHFAFLLLGVMLMFWLGLRVLMLIGKFGYSSNAEFFTDLLYRFIAVTIAAVLLSTPILEFYRIAVSPLIGVTASLAAKFSELSMADDQGRTFNQQVMAELKKQKERAGSCDAALLDKMTQKETLSGYDEATKRNCCVLSLNGEWKPMHTIESCTFGFCEQIVIPEECKFNRVTSTGKTTSTETFTCSYCSDAMDPMAVLPHTTAFTPVLDDQTINALLCLTCTVYKQFSPMVESGSAIFRYAAVDNSSGWYVFSLPDPFMGFFLGLALMILFGMLTFIVAFRLIDIFLRLGFVIVLTPLLITAWAFPISRKYAKKGWDFIVGSLLEFLSIAIATALLMNLTMVMLPDSALEKLIPAMAGTDVKNLYNAFTGEATGGSLYTMMILICVFAIGIKLLQVTQKIVENVSGISLGIPAMSSAAAKQMLDQGVGMAKKVGNITGVSDAVKGVGKAMSEGTSTAMGSFMGGASLTESVKAGHSAGMGRLKKTGAEFAKTPAGKMVSGGAKKGAGAVKWASDKSGVTQGVSAGINTMKAMRSEKDENGNRKYGFVDTLMVGGLAAHLAGKGQAMQSLKDFKNGLQEAPQKMKSAIQQGKQSIGNYIQGRKTAFNGMLDNVAAASQDLSQRVQGGFSSLKAHANNISNLIKNPKMAAQVAQKYAGDKLQGLAEKTSSKTPLETLKNAAAGAGVVAKATLKHPIKSWKNVVGKIDAATAHGMGFKKDMQKRQEVFDGLATAAKMRPSEGNSKY